MRPIDRDGPPRAGDGPEQARLTIDELAQRTGITTRTIRSYQDRGLLAPPVIIGRTGYYDADHVARLHVIGHLLEERFSLAAIGALFEAWDHGRTLGELLGFVGDAPSPRPTR